MNINIHLNPYEWKIFMLSYFKYANYQPIVELINGNSKVKKTKNCHQLKFTFNFLIIYLMFFF